jgi:hypothetical protein
MTTDAPFSLAELREWIEARAVAQDECWIWKLVLLHGKQPQGKYKGKIILVRREILKAKKGENFNRNWFAVCSCETHGCVRPEHIVGKARSAMQKGRKMPEHQKAAIAKARRANAKLSEENVASIRDSDVSAVAEAERHGICKDYVHLIRAHKVWKNYSNPFSGLMT